MLQIIIIVIAVAADQLTKNLLVPMLQNLPEPHSITIISNVFSLTYVKNNGASFGILSGAQAFFIVITIIILVAGIIFMIKTRNSQSTFLKVCLSLIVGGALGNFIDRVAFGYVRDIFDFTHVYFPWIFNVADSCLVIGAILLAIYVLFIYKGKENKKEESEKEKISEQ